MGNKSPSKATLSPSPTLPCRAASAKHTTRRRVQTLTPIGGRPAPLTLAPVQLRRKFRASGKPFSHITIFPRRHAWQEKNRCQDDPGFCDVPKLPCSYDPATFSPTTRPESIAALGGQKIKKYRTAQTQLALSQPQWCVPACVQCNSPHYTPAKNNVHNGPLAVLLLYMRLSRQRTIQEQLQPSFHGKQDTTL